MVYENTTNNSSFFNREKLKNLPKLKKEYEIYKNNFIKQGGLESDEKLLTYEEFKELNEKEENDNY